MISLYLKIFPEVNAHAYHLHCPAKVLPLHIMLYVAVGTKGT
jgi:hypothetical protein